MWISTAVMWISTGVTKPGDTLNFEYKQVVYA